MTSAAIRAGRTVSTKTLEYTLIVLIFLESLVMWLGLPLG